MFEWGLLLGTTLMSVAGTALVLHFAPALRWVRDPNDRDSHEGLIPHGGGVGIALVSMAAGGLVVYFPTSPPIPKEEGLRLLAILGLALPLGVVGLVDDIQHLSAKVRFGVQVAVVSGLLVFLSELPGFSISPFFLMEGEGFRVDGWVLLGLVLFAGVWWINLFNFMDGIDGLAGMQAVFMLVMGAGLAARPHPEVMVDPVCLLMLYVAAATIGFLWFNWPPAKIFMGDCGSTWLGFMIFAFALLSIQADRLSYAFWLVLAAVFVTDATVTLATRMLRGDRWYEAHCNHAYQRLSRRWKNGNKGGQRSVTLLASAINLAWLAPLAWACLNWPEWSVAWLSLAYAPLLVGVILLGAGRPDSARADSRTHD